MNKNDSAAGRVMVILDAFLISAVVISFIQSAGDTAEQQGQTDYSGVILIPAAILVFCVSLLILMVIQIALSKKKIISN